MGLESITETINCEYHLCKLNATGYYDYKGMILAFCDKHKEWFGKLTRSEQTAIILAYNTDGALSE